MTIWQVFYRFELVSGEGKFKSNYNCLATGVASAWTQVASSTQGHSPPIEAINLIESVPLYDKNETEIMSMLGTIRNH